MTGADLDREHRIQGGSALFRAAAVIGLGFPALAWGLCSANILPADDQLDAHVAHRGVDGAPAKFRLAVTTCGASLGTSQTTPAPNVDSPREAAQLALYAAPASDASDRAQPRLLVMAPSPARASHRISADRGDHTTHYASRVRATAAALARAARDYGIDPLLLHAVAHIESRHNPQALSPAGARGLMQVMPATARRFGVQQPHHELLDPDTNVRVSAEYLKTLQARFGNNLPLVLAAYNAGEGAVEKYGRKIPPYRETQAYVRMVIDTYLQLRTAAQRTPGGAHAGSPAP